MNKHFRPISLIIIIGVLLVVTYFVSLSVIAKRTISFIPSDMTNFLYSYMDTCEKHPEDAPTYTHFETEDERLAHSRSNLKIVAYELLGAEKVNDNLYAFTLHLQKEYATYPKRYYFVGRINGKLYLMVNAHNVPEELREGFDAERFTLTMEDLNATVPAAVESVG